MFNVNVTDGSIKSEIFENNVLKSLLDNEQYAIINSNNQTIINKIKQFIPFEFFDEISNGYEKQLYAIDTTNILYKLNETTSIFEQKYSFNQFPEIIHSNNYIYLFDSNEKCVVISNSNTITIENLPKIDCFDFDENNIYFSVNNRPFSVFRGSKCELKDLSANTEQYSQFNSSAEDGTVCEIVNIKGKIYVITQYSIFRLDNENNTLIKQNYMSAEIYKSTICKIDDAIMFYTSNGLYLFDGNDLDQLTNNYITLNKNAKSFCFNQSYYIFSSIYNDFLYKYNFTDKVFSTIKIDGLYSIYILKTHSIYNLCASINQDNIYKNITLYGLNFEKVPTQKVVFKTNYFGSTKLKSIRNIFIKAEGNIKFTITSDLSEATFFVDGDRAIYGLTMEGNFFDISISSDSKFKLKSIILKVDEVGD